MRVLINRNLSAGSLFAFALYGGVFALPQFLQNVQSHTAEQTGRLLLPRGLATGLMMGVVGVLTKRVDARLLIGVGMGLVGLSMFQCQLRLAPTTPDQALFWPMILRGAGIGLAFVPLSLVALGTLPPGQVAEGAGIYNLIRQLGVSFGIAILTTLLDRRQQFHYARLVEDLTVYDPGTQQRLARIQAGLIGRGLAAFDAKRAAYEAQYVIGVAVCSGLGRGRL